MKRAASVLAIVGLSLAGAPASADGVDGATLITAVSFHLGTGGVSRWAVDLGATVGLPDELRGLQAGTMLPLTGFTYSPEQGLAPKMFGTAMHDHATLGAAPSRNRLPWGWIIGGSAIVAGALALSGSTGDQGGNGATDENSCVYGDNGVEDVDADCIGPVGGG